MIQLIAARGTRAAKGNEARHAPTAELRDGYRLLSPLLVANGCA